MKNTTISNDESKRRIEALEKIVWISNNEVTDEELQKFIDSLPIETQKIIEEEWKENNK